MCAAFLLDKTRTSDVNGNDRPSPRDRRIAPYQRNIHASPDSIATEHRGSPSSPYHQSLARRQFEDLMAAAAHERILGFLLLVKHLPPVIVEYYDAAGQHAVEQSFEHSDLCARRVEVHVQET